MWGELDCLRKVQPPSVTFATTHGWTSPCFSCSCTATWYLDFPQRKVFWTCSLLGFQSCWCWLWSVTAPSAHLAAVQWDWGYLWTPTAPFTFQMCYFYTRADNLFLARDKTKQTAVNTWWYPNCIFFIYTLNLMYSEGYLVSYVLIWTLPSLRHWKLWFVKNNSWMVISNFNYGVLLMFFHLRPFRAVRLLNSKCSWALEILVPPVAGRPIDVHWDACLILDFCFRLISSLL